MSNNVSLGIQCCHDLVSEHAHRDSCDALSQPLRGHMRRGGCDAPSRWKVCFVRVNIFITFIFMQKHSINKYEHLIVPFILDKREMQHFHDRIKVYISTKVMYLHQKSVGLINTKE